jgi:transcriptional regulator with AAA-type ATPase domain
MAIFEAADQRFAEDLWQLTNCNPFLPEWVGLERKALGPEYVEPPPAVDRQGDWGPDHLHPNRVALGRRAGRAAAEARRRLEEGVSASTEELALYENLAQYDLLRKYTGELDKLVVDMPKPPAPEVAALWKKFRKDFDHRFGETGRAFPSGAGPEHAFACFFLLRRAYYHIDNYIVGTSGPAARLRAAVWQSIFTHDLRRWSRVLYDRMGDFPTLITGPSGTGKELVARAVGLSRYVPFQPRGECFADPVAGSFYPLNLSALAPTLIESELFGHRKGAFSGAVEERKGWLEECDRHAEYGTVFLDEIGELHAEIQVKLLRVLQTRCFQRLGESADRKFRGKVIAATNRDLAAEMRAGRFREDFYYRLCADRIVTPSLREQLAEAPEDLREMLAFIARRVIADEGEAKSLAAEVADWVERNLGGTYPWPGNFRELEQCVRNVMIRQTYQPAQTRAAPDGPRQALAAAVVEGTLTARELERRYFTLVYALCGSYQEAARRLRINWRTLRGKIDQDLLQKLTPGESGPLP